MANFKIALVPTLKHEGYYANSATDRGKETYRGISRRFWPNWSGWKLIDQYKAKPNFPANLTAVRAELEVQVESFYEKEFWDVNRLTQVSNQAIANELFDTGVNMGVKVAARFLQEALNLCNRNQLDYPNLQVDGVIGAVTLNTLNKHTRQAKVLATLNVLQGKRYVEICQDDPTQEANFMGWLERVTV